MIYSWLYKVYFLFIIYKFWAQLYLFQPYLKLYIDIEAKIPEVTYQKFITVWEYRKGTFRFSLWGIWSLSLNFILRVFRYGLQFMLSYIIPIFLLLFHISWKSIKSNRDLRYLDETKIWIVEDAKITLKRNKHNKKGGKSQPKKNSTSLHWTISFIQLHVIQRQSDATLP